MVVCYYLAYVIMREHITFTCLHKYPNHHTGAYLGEMAPMASAENVHLSKHDTQFIYYYYLCLEDYDYASDSSKILLLLKSRRVSFLSHKAKVQTVNNVSRVAYYVKNKPVEWRPLQVAPRAHALPTIP